MKGNCIMKTQFLIRTCLIFISVFIASFPVSGQEKQTFEQFETRRTDQYASQLENYLRLYLVEQYGERASEAWDRDYSSIDAFERSVGPNRIRWQTEVIKPPVFTKTGALSRKPYTVEGITGEGIEIPLGP